MPDGILMRLSAVGSESDEAFATLQQFIPSLLKAVPTGKRKAFIGTKLAQALS